MGKFHRINQYIKAETVRAIGPDGTQLGVMSLPEALAKAMPPEDHDEFKKILSQTYKLHRQRFKRLKMEVPEIPMRVML